MEQTHEEPCWFAFVALSDQGQLTARHGRLCVREIQCITSRWLWGVSITPDLQVIYQGGWFH